MRPSIVDQAGRTMAKKNWIKKAVPESRRGVFKKKAEAAGKTTREYAAEHAGDSGTLGKEARLAQTLMGMRKKKSAKLYDHPRSSRS
ncbi:hypothetical protein SAMN05216337_1017136 [Bradyrhizobium brasilense]|uniref:Uncharacterized protein n=1 Tax=Bradyrhizobium brasilense TaxID=1419277 RepID=A0A1G6YXS9_9BRAD|nr:hypothetical protein [Bradyrhizobium brasilense]SDD95121.1 hypothetical protein SAMN05216337_1017136 [Bradyrhizobium brasilense]